MDLTGKIFGRLLVISKTNRKVKGGRFYYWLCRCDCGKEKEILYGSLINGFTKSCGCLNKEIVSKPRKHGFGGYASGRKSEYFAWQNMKDRCNNINNPRYKDYGGRGIKVCERWFLENGFINFITDMGMKPSKKHSIERVNNDGNYEPSNCIWATQKIQTHNKRRTVRHTINGETMIQEDWANKLGIKSSYICYHLKRGKSFQEIYNRVTVPLITANE